MKTRAIFTFFLLFLLVLEGCQQTEQQSTKSIKTIQVEKVKTENVPHQQEFSFISAPFRTSELSFRVSGPINCLDVYAGNYYKQGEVIASIDNRDFLIQQEKKQALYEQAQAEYERIRLLYERNNVSASSFEQAKANYISAKTAVQTASNELNDTRLLAPFDGYIGKVFIEQYQDIKASQPILTFEEIDRLKIEAYVTQEIAIQAKQLQEAELVFDQLPDQKYKATILDISKNTTSNHLSYLLTAQLSNPDNQLLAGMSGRLILHPVNPPNSQEKMSIPLTALCHRPQDGDYVWVVDSLNQQTKKRKITTGEWLANGRITVTTGLQPGENVAISGLRFLSEGTPVQIVEKP